MHLQRGDDFLQKYIPLLKKVTLFENIEDSDMLAMLKCLGARIHFYKKVKFRLWLEILSLLSELY